MSGPGKHLMAQSVRARRGHGGGSETILGRAEAPSQGLTQGGFDGRGQPTASPMLTAIMSGGVGISGRELYKYR